MLREAGDAELLWQRYGLWEKEKRGQFNKSQKQFTSWNISESETLQSPSLVTSFLSKNQTRIQANVRFITHVSPQTLNIIFSKTTKMGFCSCAFNCMTWPERIIYALGWVAVVFLGLCFLLGIWMLLVTIYGNSPVSQHSLILLNFFWNWKKVLFFWDESLFNFGFGYFSHFRKCEEMCWEETSDEKPSRAPTTPTTDGRWCSPGESLLWSVWLLSLKNVVR